jgi:hypothetical protein
VGRGRRPLSGSNKNNKQLRGKMKKSLLVFTILISMFSVVNISQANANCTADNPCGTWAVIDNQGVVTNVIVCQASVCGGGTFAGMTVVPQVAPDPVTHGSQGSFIGDPSQGTEVRYDRPTETFTVVQTSTPSDVITRSETEINTTENTTVATTSSVNIPVVSKSFKYEDTVGISYWDIPFSVGIVNDNKPTELIVRQETKTNILNQYNELEGQELVSAYEKATFYGQKNEIEIIQKVVQEQMSLINSKITTLLNLLRGWVK